MIDKLLKSGGIKTAIEIGSLKLSYSEVFDRIKLGSHELNQLGLQRGDVVLLQTDNRLRFFLLLLSCFRSGLSVAPISPDVSERDIDSYKEITKAKIVLGSLNELYLDTRLKSENLVPQGLDYSKSAKLIAFTSGTTGIPKGIVHPLSNLIKCAEVFCKHVGISKGMRCLHHMPHFYMAGILNTFFCPLVASGTVVLFNSFSAKNAGLAFKNLVSRDCDYSWFSPTMLMLCLKMSKSDEVAKSINEKRPTLFVGTGPLTEKCKNLYFERYSAPLLESYGTSELLIISSQKVDMNSSNDVGESLDGVKVTIAPDSEILVDSPWEMEGYLNASGRGKATGDLGAINRSGYLSIVGRKKDLIIKGGVNISPRVIEDVAFQHPDVEDACVAAKEHPLWGEVPVLFVIPKCVLDKSNLRSFLRSNLAEDRMPDEIIEVEEFPRTVTGKVKKPQLLKENIK